MSSTLNKLTDGAKEFLGGNKHDTTQTREEVLPAVTQERQQKNVHEQTQVVEDREHHQVHHQQRVQPIADQRVENTVHKHNVLPVQQHEERHDISSGAQRALQEQQTAYKDSTTTLPTQHTTESLGAVGRDVTHHHVIEQTQPVIQRDVIQPEVIHTTAATHKVIHEAPIVHEATVEPTITLDQFKAKGGSIEGTGPVSREVRAGEPAVLDHGHADGAHPHTNAIGTAGHSHKA
ncbi:hypothetical protein PYCC9005_001517 [Savitreella phatthalungensis]